MDDWRLESADILPAVHVDNNKTYYFEPNVLYDNATAVSNGFRRVWAELYVADRGDDNIQLDGSFHQHSDQGVRGALLAGSYGAVFTTDMLGFVDLAHGTALAVPSKQAAVLAALRACAGAHLRVDNPELRALPKVSE